MWRQRASRQYSFLALPLPYLPAFLFPLPCLGRLPVRSVGHSLLCASCIHCPAAGPEHGIGILAGPAAPALL